jgi:hypothetical protein
MPTVKHLSPAAAATERLKRFLSEKDSPREDFGAQITRAVDAFGARSASLTQKRHRENVARARSRYRKPKRRAPSVSR